VIQTEYGLHFRGEGDRWRCVELPELVMLRGGRYQVEGLEFDPLVEALRAAKLMVMVCAPDAAHTHQPYLLTPCMGDA
jgi:hypothetical protein